MRRDRLDCLIEARWIGVGARYVGFSHVEERVHDGEKERWMIEGSGACSSLDFQGFRGAFTARGREDQLRYCDFPFLTTAKSLVLGLRV